ncbi:Two-component response regulator [Labilithrix luteola]|uniref:Two-component response regulator n=1 Tax=Labilithrix luteola TaxID=1391654 RepID=A0A0K1PL74_9BACT|nr:response regulator [Labilithrix luteola]AKU94270.1 Two-component response regulator [Labilithrix luteola]
MISDSVPFREPSPRALNVVLVEDDAIDVMNVRRAFDKGKIANPLYVAGDGIEALEMLRSHAIPKERRIILLDINLPRMNGIELLQEIRKDPILRPTPVVILTTSNDDHDKFKAYDLNVAGYLLKPVTFVSFVEIMAALNRYWTVVELS